MEEAANIVGLRFGRFRAIREIGRGATSCVYLAQDDGDVSGADAFGASEWSQGAGKPKQVAIKLVDFTDDRSKLSRRFRKLFATEAAVTAQFDHPNIARVYDWKVEEKRAYLVMELVEGTGLDQFVTMDKLLPMHRVVGIIFKVAMALDYAHRRGIVHRDIKPANVMLTKEDDVKLMDFGLALNIRKNVNVDSTFINGLGSPSYMSPEQIKGYTLNHQTDLYSLGVMFYQLLTGRLPFRGPNTAALVYKIINTEAVVVTQLNPDIPEETNKVITRSLEKDLYSRYRLGADMAKDLSAVRFQILEENAVVANEARWKAVRGLPLLGKLDDVDVWELLRLSAWRELPPATVIMRDGEAGKSFGFIIEGEVEVEKGERALAQLGRGEMIGEVAFLQSEGGTRIASVTTLNQVTYLEINAAAFAFATEELVAEIRRLAVDAMIDRMRTVNRVARHYSPVAVHPTALPEGEAEAPAIVAAAPLQAPGWSVFSKPARVSPPDAAQAPAVSPGAVAPRAAAPPAALWPPSPAAEPPSKAVPALTARGSTVVVQPLPPAAAAVLAQMAMTQQSKGYQPAALQPFELGPEATGDALQPLSVSELPADAVLTTELGAHFDASLQMATTELAGGFHPRSADIATTEMGARFDSPGAMATTEMAADFGRLPTHEEPRVLAAEFDIHARTGRGPLQAAGGRPMPTYAATTEMVAHLGLPTATGPSDFGARGANAPPEPRALSSLLPQTRPVADQSTQEMASLMLGRDASPEPESTMELAGGFGLPDEDPMAQFGRDMFPPIGGAALRPAAGESPAGADEDDYESYEATQVLDPSRFAAPFPEIEGLPPVRAGVTRAAPLSAGARRPVPPAVDEDEEPYESTQALDMSGYAAPPPLDYDQTAELPGGFGTEKRPTDAPRNDPFPPLKF